MDEKALFPKRFKVANQEISVVIEDSLPDSNYGYFCDVTNVIKLARTIDTEYDGVVTLTEEQMRNTFWHEVIHVFQFYFNTNTDEAQAQSFANFMREFESSREYDTL